MVIHKGEVTKFLRMYPLSSKLILSARYLSLPLNENNVKVSLRRMKFYAFHGFYEFERKVGNNFEVDITVDLNMESNPNEQIENTVNYEDIYTICNEYMRKKYRLLETLAFDIAQEIKDHSDLILHVQVTLSKLNPPLPGKVERSEIVVDL